MARYRPGLASRRKKINWGMQDRSGVNNNNFTGGRYVDDKGYLRVLEPEHPFNNKGYVYEHRLVMEKYLGRYLETFETVHHINEVKLDNRPENLFLCNAGEHSAIHREGKERSQDYREKMKRRQTQNYKKRKKGPDGRFLPSEK